MPSHSVHIRTNTVVIGHYWAYPSARKAITTYYYLLATLRGGTLFRPTPRTLAKVKWSKSVYHRRVKGLIEAGLAHKDQWGNIRLKRTEDLIQEAREILGRRSPITCKYTIILPAAPTEKQVRVALLDKLFERRVAQVSYAPKKRRAQTLSRKMMRYTHRSSARLLKQGFVPVTTRTAVRHLGISRTSFYRYRKQTRAFTWHVVRENLGFVGRMAGKRMGRGVVDRKGNLIQQYPTLYRLATDYSLKPCRRGAKDTQQLPSQI